MKLQSIILACVLSTSCVVAQLEPGDYCLTKEKSNGTCTIIENCKVALKINKRKRRLLLQRCGFQGLKEVICCPAAGSNKIVYDVKKIAEAECNKLRNTMPIGGKIIGGEPAKLGELPHTVALGFPIPNSTLYKFECGGTILSPRFVLTAAHCIDNTEQIPPTIVRVGVVDLGEHVSNNFSPEYVFNFTTDIVIAKTIVHPNFTRRTRYDDIAILKLQKSLTFSKFINAACLDTNVNVLPAEERLEVCGWGVISRTRNLQSRVLMKTFVHATCTNSCNTWYENNRRVPQGVLEGQFCAGDEKGESDTCLGDSGGPVTVVSEDAQHYVLVGVTSFGRGCGSEVPAIYTRVAYYIDWIVRLVWPIE